MTDEKRAAIEAAGVIARAERKAQGLPEIIEDPLIYRKLLAAYDLISLLPEQGAA